MPRKQLSVEIALLLCAKLVALTALYFAFFSPSHRITADAPTTSTHVLGTNTHS
ncbi:MAG TPA: hypothetical protein VMF58_16705 [Rhizomicrobium sp.]|nr:hypothetical protein [Rhizomicrobium sp.]